MEPRAPDRPATSGQPTPDLGGAARDALRWKRPRVLAAVVASLVAAAAVWPMLIGFFSNTTVSPELDVRVTWWLVAISALAGAASVVHGSVRRIGQPGTVSWMVVATGALAWCAAAILVANSELSSRSPGTVVGIAAGGSPGRTMALLGTVAIIGGAVTIPSGIQMTLRRRIDVSLVLSAVLSVLWSATQPLITGRTSNTATAGLLVVLAAAAFLGSASLMIRSMPHHHSEVRGLVAALAMLGIGLLMAARTVGSDPQSQMGALAWSAMGMCLVTAGLRLGEPWSGVAEARRRVDRFHGWLPAGATVVGLGTVALHQRVTGGLDPVMTALGVLVVALSGARGALTHEHNKELLEQLGKAADELSRAGRTDPLTGLGNRLALEERLAVALERRASTGLSVLFIDIDNFKDVNDSLGHEVGDQLLGILAHRLCEVLGSDVFRIGGDEFVAVREDLDRAGAEAMAAAVVASLGPRVHLEEHQLSCGASVGLARSEGRTDGLRHRDDPRQLLRRADLALYRAKELGRGQWATYEPWLQERADRRLSIQQGLAAAIDKSQLLVRYQPIVRLDDGATVGAEALVRWDNPAFGMLLPGEFLPAAHEAGLLPAIGRYVTSAVLATLTRHESPGWISVNLSADELAEPGFAAGLLAAMRTTAVAPRRLRVEVTEAVLLDPPTRAVLLDLADAGIGICIEDFGTGPTSLQHFGTIGDLTLKVDRSFLGGPGPHRDDPTLLRAVMELAHDMDTRVAVEAVTTERQVEALRSLGVEEAQGWVFGQAMPWEQLAAPNAGAPVDLSIEEIK